MGNRDSACLWSLNAVTFAVLLSLKFNADESRPLLLGLDAPYRLTVSEKKVVGLAKSAAQSEFANGNPAAGVDVGVGPVLDEPPSGFEHAVDGFACLFFRRQSLLKALGHQRMTTTAESDLPSTSVSERGRM